MKKFMLCLTLLVPTATRAQSAPPVRDLGPVIAKSADRIRFVTANVPGLWEFANGHVMVSDGGHRRLLLFDSSLATVKVVADSTGKAPIPYGTVVSPLVPFRGDSVFFLDFASRTMLLFGSNGDMGRPVAPIKYSDMVRIRNNSPGVDARGRLLYRVPRPWPLANGPQPTFALDSSRIVRADFETRAIDTIGAIFRPSDSPTLVQVRGADQRVSFTVWVRPVLWIDEWTVLPDGTVAIVRGHDYHIDWIAPDGKMTSSPKMPFDWRRLSDADKSRMSDSARTAVEQMVRSGMPVNAARSYGVADEDMRLTPGPDGTSIVPVSVSLVPIADIPDYVAPMRSGAVLADREGNVWILPNTSLRSRKGGLVYDVVNRKGEIFERVEVPAGCFIAGFGRGAAAYLLCDERPDGFVVERAHIR